jgi:hypothetical protein
LGCRRVVLYRQTHIESDAVSAAEHSPEDEDKENGKGKGPEKGRPLPDELLDITYQELE